MSNPRDRHEPARRAARSIRTAEKHRLENLASEVGAHYLAVGDVPMAVLALEAINVRYTKILVQERLEAEEASA